MDYWLRIYGPWRFDHYSLATDLTFTYAQLGFRLTTVILDFAVNRGFSYTANIRLCAIPHAHICYNFLAGRNLHVSTFNVVNTSNRFNGFGE
jgi:hypothetical protein